MNSGGTLNIEGALLQGENTGGCWQGVRYNMASSGHVTDSEIRDAVVGIYAYDAGTEFSRNYIHDLLGLDGVTPGEYGAQAAGISVEVLTASTVPVIEGNTIETVTGGNGQTGDLAFAGGNGGHAIGILLSINGDISNTPVISDNQIFNIRAGNGGDGIPGDHGMDGDLGIPAWSGNDGTYAGEGGWAYGINQNGAAAELTGNIINGVFAGNGGSGGPGGDGGWGGPGEIYTGVPEMGGSGGDGGNGGPSGVGGMAYGLMRTNSAGIALIENNQVAFVQGGIGGRGGDGGAGGTGGTGGMGNSTMDPTGAMGGSGGQGGSPGASSYGGDAYGIYTATPIQINANTVSDITGGNGSSGANGGAGGDGGQGGTGGIEAEGNGGPGGTGGTGGNAAPGGYGGMSGNAYGFYVEGSDSWTQYIASNNDIYDVSSGWSGGGGFGADGGAGGTGGDGGAPMSGLNPGPGGNGGDGGLGSPGAMGSCRLGLPAGQPGRHPVPRQQYPGEPLCTFDGRQPGISWHVMEPAALVDGHPGSTGTTPTDTILPASSGSGGVSYGILVLDYLANAVVTSMRNNILVDQNGYANGVGLTSISSPLMENYNNLFGWTTPIEPGGGVTPGDHSDSVDPLFRSSSDHRLMFHSPSVDQGDNSIFGIPGMPGFDHDGNPRIQNGAVDKGAFEFPEDVLFIPLVRRP